MGDSGPNPISNLGNNRNAPTVSNNFTKLIQRSLLLRKGKVIETDIILKMTIESQENKFQFPPPGYSVLETKSGDLDATRLIVSDDRKPPIQAAILRAKINRIITGIIFPKQTSKGEP